MLSGGSSYSYGRRMFSPFDYLKQDRTASLDQCRLLYIIKCCAAVVITCSDWWILDHISVLFIQGCGGFPTSPPVNMTPSMLRRQLKNLVQNYSEAEVKVGTLPEDIPSSFPPSDRLFLMLLLNAEQTQAEEGEATEKGPFPSSRAAASTTALDLDV